MITLSFIICHLAFSIALTSCGQTSVPTEYKQSEQLPKIYPDYVNVTVPANIAPLTFMLDIPTADMIARYKAGDEEVVYADKMQPTEEEWQRLKDKARGGAIEVDVFTRTDDQWTRFKPFHIYVSPDSIDPYISYRLIAPSFVSYEALTINQRCLENYDESVIYDNILNSLRKTGSASTAIITRLTIRNACSSTPDSTTAAPFWPSTES